jgi:protoheme IX farnesyltransferase
LYLAAAALLGAWFVFAAVRLHRDPGTPRAIELFRYSILYLFALFLMMSLDASWRRFAS